MTTFAETYDYHYTHHHHHHGYSAMPEAAPSNAQSAERSLLAERYKTKMCRNYLVSGECPYEVRCMFAHGDHELRTTEMNVRDGLVTEEAIKAFQRSVNIRNRQAYQAQEMYASTDYVGMPPMDLGPNRYAHNPYGYAVMHSVPVEEYYVPAYSSKVDPEAAMEP